MIKKENKKNRKMFIVADLVSLKSRGPGQDSLTWKNMAVCH